MQSIKERALNIAIPNVELTMTTEDFVNNSISLKQAAKFFGFDNIESLRRKLKAGEIPGFKCGKRWMLLKTQVMEHVYRMEENLKVHSVIKVDKTWQLAKRKVAHIGIRDSQSAELECKNLLEQLHAWRRRNMKTNAEKT